MCSYIYLRVKPSVVQNEHAANFMSKNSVKVVIDRFICVLLQLLYSNP